ncbi:MAG: GAF domain-containing protein [Bernardetiaceae bacterium]|jgi:methyl-accepting chemotaxis protein|nr:GAF domain-containing protein [Bernardetiaceae bacterium]
MLGVAHLFVLLLAGLVLLSYGLLQTPDHWLDEFLLGLLAGLLALLYFTARRGLLLPLQKLASLAQRPAASPANYAAKFSGELKRIYLALTQAWAGTAHATQFVRQLAQGDLQARYPGPEAEQDEKPELVAALLDLQQRLAQLAQRDREINWANQGLARFAEVLRVDGRSAAEIGRQIIEQVVKYLDACYGALYALANEDGEVFLRLNAAYAYPREPQATIEPGEGLVGQVFLDKTVLHLTEFTPDFLPVSSGLGQAPPRQLILVPAMFNNEVLGVAEIATFHELKQYQVDFLLKLGQNIAASLASAHHHQKSSDMGEDAEFLASMMRTQEAALRENMERAEALTKDLMRQNREIDQLRQDLQRKTEQHAKAQEAAKEQIGEFQRQLAAKEAELLALKG